MKTVVTRSMTVMNSKGEAENFEKTPNGEFREDIDIDTYGRLNRAGAAVLYVEDDGSVEVLADPETKADAIIEEVGGALENPVTGQDVAPTEGVTHQEQLEGADQGGDTGTGSDASGAGDRAEESHADLMKLSKDELADLGRLEKADFASGATKAEIADAILAKRKAS